MSAMLQVNGLSKEFTDVRAVDELSFELEAGKICGFVGPNGAGKTTTMRIIATLEEPTAGAIAVDGMDVFENVYEVRRRLGFMPDHYGVYPAMNARDYLEFYARAYEVPSRVRNSRIGQIMEFTGLDVLAEKLVETLSKGQRQRLNLARALINDPKLLIMDEPAAGLDPRARVELRYLMKALSEQGKTLFVSSHILSELSEVCDSMLIIDRGRLISFGTFAEIQKQLRDTVDISVRLLKPEQAGGLELFLMERPDIHDIRIGENGRIHFSMTDDLENVTYLLREMIHAEFSVIEFQPKAMSMEEIFIQITRGEPS